MSSEGGSPEQGAGTEEATGGTGAALGTQVLRYSSIHSVGVLVSNLLTFATIVLIANFVDPAEFGQLGLLLFLAALMTLLFTLASKQGTMKRTFGGDDDEEDDDEQEGELSSSPRRTLGTGLALIGLVSIAGTLAVVALAGPIADGLLGAGADRSLVVWAAIAGGAGALFRVASIAIWIERRPYAYITVEAARPLVTLVIVVPLLIGGAGLEGAIAGTAAGSAVATALALLVLRGSWEPCFELPEALAIYRKGAIRVPLVLSMWIVSYADVFILSRFVSDADLGIYVLASRAGFVVAFLPSGYRKALRPLMKTTTFRAVEDQYGVGTARGTQLAYFVLMVTGILLAITVLAQALVRVAPDYTDAASLIPLLAAGLMAPTAYRMLNKSVKYANKRVPFIAGAVVAATLFIGLALLLIPPIGLEAPPLAMIGAFLPPALFIYWRSQRGRTPIRIPWRPILTAIGLAVAIGFGHSLLDVAGLVPQIVLGLAAVGLWMVLVPLTGAIPAYHRAPLIAIVRSAFGDGEGFDPALGLEALTPTEREALRLAIVERRPPPEAAGRLTEAGADAAGALLVGLLRRTALGGGAPGLPGDYATGADPERDELIGGFLFAPGPIAERDQIAKRLLGGPDPDAEAFDLHTLEDVVSALRGFFIRRNGE